MIKAVTFDLDGVYFTPQSFKKFKNDLPKKVTDEDKVNWVLYKSPEMFNFKSGKMAENDYWDFVRQELGVELDNAGIFQLLQDSYEVNPEVRTYVERIKAAGLKTCICSNNFVTRIRELNNKFDFLADFDARVFSYEVGIMKPEKGIFEALIKQADVKPEEIVYADDDKTKLKGALELGIKAFVYEGFDKYIQQLESLGVKV